MTRGRRLIAAPPYFGMHRFEWPGESGVEFYLGYGIGSGCCARNGFEVVDLIEVQAPKGAVSPSTSSTRRGRTATQPSRSGEHAKRSLVAWAPKPRLAVTSLPLRDPWAATSLKMDLGAAVWW
jgi:hypothetical protein